MEEGRNIPLIVMLSAGSIISIACIAYRFTLYHTLIFVLLTLVVFYVVGLIIRKIILTINRDAEERAALLEKEKKEAEQKAQAESESLKATESTATEDSWDEDESITVE